MPQHTTALCLALSLLITAGTHAQPSDALTVYPVAETEPVPTTNDDAADDPAIWIDTEDPRRSLILGTDKKAGLGIYDLQGNQLEFLNIGPLNNIDVRHAVRLGARRLDIAVATRIPDDTLVVFEIDPGSRRLTQLGDAIPTGLDKVYGICLARDANDAPVVIISTKSGTLRQWTLSMPDGTLHATVERTIEVGSKVEGLVADEQYNALYVGEEEVAIWKYTLDPKTGDARERLQETVEGGQFEPDVEGLALYRLDGGNGCIIASSQGSDSYHIFDRRPPHRFITRFQIGERDGIDQVTHTDGIDVTSVPLGSDFPRGLFVAQDDENPGAAQNFKIVGWHELLEAADDHGLPVGKSDGPR